MSAEIFVSYRRDDSAAWAGRISEHLSQAFGADRVFMDVNGIPPGRNFVRLLDQRISDAEVVLAIIGPTWLTATNANGLSRLHEENDFVRLELESALRLGKTVIPVLVGGAKIPVQDSLPNTLLPLTKLNAISVSHEKFPSDVAMLVRATRDAAAQRAGEDALNAGFGTWVLNSLGWAGSLVAGTFLGVVVAIPCMAIVIEAFDGDKDWPAIVLGCALGTLAFTAFAYLFWRNFSLFSKNRPLFNFLFGLPSGVALVCTILWGLLAVIPAYYYFCYKVARS